MSDDLTGAIHDLERAEKEIERLRLFFGEIAAMGPADDEWDADTLEDAVELAKRALAGHQQTQKVTSETR